MHSRIVRLYGGVLVKLSSSQDQRKVGKSMQMRELTWIKS
jgi:hypothetical protein